MLAQVKFIDKEAIAMEIEILNCTTFQVTTKMLTKTEWLNISW